MLHYSTYNMLKCWLIINGAEACAKHVTNKCEEEKR